VVFLSLAELGGKGRNSVARLKARSWGSDGYWWNGTVTLLGSLIGICSPNAVNACCIRFSVPSSCSLRAWVNSSTFASKLLSKSSHTENPGSYCNRRKRWPLNRYVTAEVGLPLRRRFTQMFAWRSRSVCVQMGEFVGACGGALWYRVSPRVIQSSVSPVDPDCKMCSLLGAE